jgi:hypothetical protein
VKLASRLKGQGVCKDGCRFREEQFKDDLDELFDFSKKNATKPHDK